MHVAPTNRPRSKAALAGAVIVALGIAFFHGGIPDDGDFSKEARLAYLPLMDGDFAGFWNAMPGYVTFVLLVGAPCALVADWFGWGTDAAFRLTTLPGALLLAGLAAHLAGHVRGNRRGAVAAVVFLGAGGPVAWLAVHYGHPEELLAAGAAVAAVLFAMRDRWVVSVLLLGVAVLAKQWAVLAILPAAAAAPENGLRILLATGAAAVGLIGVQLTFHPLAAHALTDTSSLFHTRQIWYPLGIEAVGGAAADAERLAPEWLQRLTRPLTVFVGAALSATWFWRRRSGRVAAADVLALLALVFLLRCMLDPWNFFYYHLPLCLSLVAWEVLARRRFPVLSALVAAFVFLGALRWEEYQGWAAYFSYVGWSVPLLGYLGVQAFGLHPAHRRRPVAVRTPAPLAG